MVGNPLRIGLLIRALNFGGAERQLVNLARGLHRMGHDVHVLVFYRVGTSLEAELETAGVPLVDLKKHGRWDLLGFFMRLRDSVRWRQLDVIYSFLPTSNVVAATIWGGGRPPAVVWGVRSTDAWRCSDHWLGRAVVFVERYLAPRAIAIVANSTTAIESCRALGWPAERLHLVQNGLDSETFQFSAESREEMRVLWRVSPADRLIGVAGRLDPVKGLDVLLAAIQKVSARWPEVRVVVAGTGSSSYMSSLRQMAHELGVEDRIVWLGHVQNMAAFYSAVDFLCSPSLTEGCSNVVGEALACGTPVVATRVGDNQLLVPNASWLAESGNPVDLARVLQLALSSSDVANRDVLRQGILDRLQLSAMTEQSLAVLSTAANCVRPSPVA